jgi:hypothetical protein
MHMQFTITPTELLHFGTQEVHSFPTERCVCLAALRCRGCCSAYWAVHTLDTLEPMPQTICVDGLTEMVAEGERLTLAADTSRWCCVLFCTSCVILQSDCNLFPFGDRLTLYSLSNEFPGSELFSAYNYMYRATTTTNVCENMDQAVKRLVGEQMSKCNTIWNPLEADTRSDKARCRNMFRMSSLISNNNWTWYLLTLMVS